MALKVLPREAVADAEARARLLAEARAAAGLNHPGICTIHDVGEQDGEVFVAMELVTGTRLDTLSGQLEPGRVRAIAVQLASALAHAHDSGVVHRDLKGANVMLTADGRVKVLDFGLARHVRSDVSEDSRSQTTLDPAGRAAGTLAYMSPEALRGDPPDPRSDVWSLGVVLFELVKGSRPFGGATGHELASAILRDPAPPLPAETPRDIAAVVARCLAKQPGERYARAGEVRAALELGAAPEAARRGMQARGLWRRPGAGMVLAGVALVGSAALWLATRPARPHIDAIAVLPFENLSHDPAQDYFSDGMTDQLITTLARIGSLRVTSRTSVMRWKGAPRPPREVGRALDVGAVLEGSVLRDGQRVRIGVRLVETSGERHLWAESYERDASDVLRLQAEIAHTIADQVQARLTPHEAQQLAGTRQIDPRAYDLLLLGEHHTRQRNAEDSIRAVDLLRQAAAIDPESGLVHAALATAYREQDTWASLGPGRSAALIRSEANRAVELDPGLAQAHLALARLHLDVDWDWPATERELDRALDLNHSLAEAHMTRAFLKQTLADDAAALSAAERAVTLEPLSPPVLSDHGRVLYRARRFDQAVAQFRKALDLDRDFVPALVRLADTYTILAAPRELSEVLTRLERVEERLPSLALESFRINLALLEGRRDEARRRIEATDEALSTTPAGEYAFTLACLNAPVDRGRALGWLERGVRERSLFPLQLRDPQLDPVRADPRFKALLAQLRMPE